MATRKIFSTFILNILSTRAFQKSITLNNTNLGSNGIGIGILQNHVETINNTWHINPTSQYGFDISIEMHNEWGFNPFVSSTITFIIDGYTPNITTIDGEFLLLFGVDNKYFSVVIRLEDGTAWKSYPDYKYSKLATNNNIFTNLIMSGSTERWNRISNNDQWTNIGHPNLHKIGLEWPLKISITNNPNENTLLYICKLSNRILYVYFNDSFATNQGLNTYIMNDASDGKPFDIYSIEVIYEYMTISPSISPTISPITSDPTLYPTTPSPTLFIPDATLNPTISDQQIDITISTEPNYKHIKDIHGNNDIFYIIIIVILFTLLCIVTLILIRKQYYNNNNSSEKYLRNRLPPDYIRNQLGHAIVNNGSGSNSKLAGDDQKEDESDSASDLYDSAEEIYAQNDTPIGTEENTLMKINVEGNIETNNVKVTAIPI